MPDEPKPSRSQRRTLARAAADAGKPPELTPAEVVRRRRRRRLVFLGALAVLIPLLEVVAYQFRSIQFVVVNRSDAIVHDVKLTYPGGSFEAAELKAGSTATHAGRPEYAFRSGNFSTYWATISVKTPDNGFIRLSGRIGTVDYSARETYTIQPDEANQQLVIKHTTHPGFPLGTIRDLVDGLMGR